MKWFLAIPHYVVLVFLWIAAVMIVIIAWFAILFTGQYQAPRRFVRAGLPSPSNDGGLERWFRTVV